LAQVTQASIEVLSSWQTPFPSIELLAIGMNLELSEVTERPLSIAQYRMKKSLHEAFGANTPANVTEVIEEGNPGILLVEKSKRFDLLILGNRGHTPIVETLLGSVSQHCLAHAHCPVVIVK
jgi:nucleotide-binding universal stress UspA family protein